jgi:hypothetical protein
VGPPKPVDFLSQVAPTVMKQKAAPAVQQHPGAWTTPNEEVTPWLSLLLTLVLIAWGAIADAGAYLQTRAYLQERSEVDALVCGTSEMSGV